VIHAEAAVVESESFEVMERGFQVSIEILFWKAIICSFLFMVHGVRNVVRTSQNLQDPPYHPR
jgi:hypothetical protein